MKYKLKEGSHSQKGVTYSKGDIVESDLNLVELFPNKFEQVHEAAPPPASVSGPTNTPSVPAQKTEDGEWPTPKVTAPTTPPAEPVKKTRGRPPKSTG